MLNLVLIRHGKSSWKYQDLEDYERPLNDRGRSDIP
jgi:phosphohistidine phosphatase